MLTDLIPPTVCSALPCRNLLTAGRCPGASLCVRGPEEQLRQVLMRVGVSVLSPKCSHCQPSKRRGENIKHRLLPFHLTPTLTFLFKTALRNALRVAWSSEQPWPTQHPLNSRRTLPCRGLLFPPTASPQSATGSSPGRLSAEPGRWQSPCPGHTGPWGVGTLLGRTVLGTPGCTPSFTRLQPYLGEGSCRVLCL